MTLEQLQELRNELAKKIADFAKRFADQDQQWKDDEERTNWEKLNADYDDTVRQMEQIKTAADVARRAKAVEEQQSRPGERDDNRRPGRDDTTREDDNRQRGRDGLPDEETRALALASFCRARLGHSLEQRHRDAMTACRMDPWQNQLTWDIGPTSHSRSIQHTWRTHHRSRAAAICAEHRAAMSSVTFGDGGALVPETFLQMLEINMLAFGGVLQACDRLNTQRGERMAWPTVDDTSNSGEQVGESSNVDNSGAGGPLPSFSAIYWDAYKFSSKAILVPYELLEDEFYGLPALLGQMMGERLGRILNSKFTNGSGAGTPKGIVTAAELGKTAASTTAITFNEVIELEHSVDPAYRSNAGYMCHDNVVLALRLLKDDNGQYLWQNGIDTNTPDRLNGHPLFVNMDMASSIEASAKSILFGQLNKYKARFVRQARTYRLEERYRDSDQDGFISLIRADGNLLNAGTAPVKYLQQAAS